MSSHDSERNTGSSSFALSEVDFQLLRGETMVVELNVTPKVEGILNILGVRWTLSGSVVGYHNFDPDLIKKKRVKGRRNVQSSSNHNLKFIVIKTLPKLEGRILHLPKKAYAGELRRLVLELKNQSEFSVKNLKMKISPPRFLIPGNLKDIDVEFPACLEKKTRECSDQQADGIESSDLLFSFPSETTIQGGTTFLWPLWLHTGISGTTLNFSIYYEMENPSNDMSYRTLRMHYNLEVLPSLDVSYKVTPCPSRLQEFLVRMDITNRTSSESFWLQQLSSVGYRWKISSLPPYVSICPSQLLLAGQALSCFFRLEDCGKYSSARGTDTSLDMHQESDVYLGSEGNHKVLIDISGTPLEIFHRHERLHLEKVVQDCQDTVDFILISRPQEYEVNLEPGSLPGSSQLFSHHACLCSIGDINPICWLMDGPRIVEHDFSVSFCEVRLQMTIHNGSDVVTSVKIHTSDTAHDANQQQIDVAQSSASGWHDVSLSKDVKVFTDAQGTQSGQLSSQSISPFVWSASSSTRITLKPMSTAQIPLEICVFSPGTYNLSNYALHWSLQLSGSEQVAVDATKQSSGTSPGHPFYLTVLQTP